MEITKEIVPLLNLERMEWHSVKGTHGGVHLYRVWKPDGLHTKTVGYLVTVTDCIQTSIISYYVYFNLSEAIKYYENGKKLITEYMCRKYNNKNVCTAYEE